MILSDKTIMRMLDEGSLGIVPIEEGQIGATGSRVSMDYDK